MQHFVAAKYDLNNHINGLFDSTALRIGNTDHQSNDTDDHDPERCVQMRGDCA